MHATMEQLDKLVKKTLSPKRYHHTACVVKQAQKLARIYGCDEQKATVAAWLHDICKEQKYDEQLQWLTKFGIILDSAQKQLPKTWHGMAACGFMKLELGIDDPEILHAVRYHTTACGRMSAFDEVIYLADLTSEERDYPDVERVRHLAETDRAAAMREGMIFAVCDLAERGIAITQDTFEAYNFYITKNNA